MKTALSFSDVLILPKFSSIPSREVVDTGTKLMGLDLKLGIISSNMDTVTEETMAIAMANEGAIGCLHRFMPINKNVWMFEQVKKHADKDVLVSVGVGKSELERFHALLDAGADHFVVDVANGAAMHVVEHVQKMRDLGGSNFQLMVGNFATGNSINAFLHHLGENKVDAFKVGVGGGSACITRQVSGCGMPTFASVLDCVRETNIPIVADGGIRNSSDFAKSLAAGAKAVMIGGMLAGTDESPGQVITDGSLQYSDTYTGGPTSFKSYRGSASAESYKAQGKTAKHRAPEGESFLVPYVGSVASVLQELEGGLRGSMSTVGAMNIEQFRYNAEFVSITSNGVLEGGPHGKTHK